MNKLLTTLSSSILALTLSWPSFGQTQVPHDFQSGQPARAVEVNENFDALEDAIEVNTASIATNEASIEAIEELITQPGGGDVVTLDLAITPIVISEPGVYILQRSWEIVNTEPDPQILIEANDVILDLRGFTITQPREGYTVVIDADNVTLRNGVIDLQDQSGYAISSTGAETVLEGIKVRSPNGVTLGERASVRNSRISGRGGLTIGPGSSVEFSNLVCTFTCVRANGDNSRITDTVLLAAEPAVSLTGSRMLFARNTVTVGSFGGPGLQINGNDNLVEANIFAPDSDTFDGSLIVVAGSGNILNGNVLRPGAGGPGGTGIEFQQDGNFYGDNRMSAIMPFELGGTMQTDWGGNVGF